MMTILRANKIEQQIREMVEGMNLTKTLIVEFFQFVFDLCQLPTEGIALRQIEKA